MEELATVPAAVVGAVLGVLSALAVATQRHKHDRHQQARLLLLPPAEEFARSVVASLAALRYVTPPTASAPAQPQNRNAVLLTDRQLREDRLELCREKIDIVRQARAHVRLVFQPQSWAAEMSRRVLMDLRNCLESAEHFYLLYDDLEATNREVVEHAARYTGARKEAYVDLDTFFEEVAERLVKPSWGTRIEVASAPDAVSQPSDYEA